MRTPLPKKRPKWRTPVLEDVTGFHERFMALVAASVANCRARRSTVEGRLQAKVHDQVVRSLCRSPEDEVPEPSVAQAGVDHRRWLTVRKAKQEGRSWPKAQEEASKRLAGTPFQGSARTMRQSYDRIQEIRRFYEPWRDPD